LAVWILCTCDSTHLFCCCLDSGYLWFSCICLLCGFLWFYSLFVQCGSVYPFWKFQWWVSKEFVMWGFIHMARYFVSHF
jgi:hypothetical protein